MSTLTPVGPQNKSCLTVTRMAIPDGTAIAQIDSLMDSHTLTLHRIGCVNWAGYPSTVEAAFRIAWSGHEIFVKFYVREPEVRAVHTGDETSLPFRDSCVEFFIAPDDSGIYYNIEMNPIGAALFKGGTREHRERFSAAKTAAVRRLASMGMQPFDTRTGDFSWTLTMAVPVDIFSLSPAAPLEGRTVGANFYKCGDHLPSPHYLSWSPIKSPAPNFHLPGEFGSIFFE